LFSSQRQLARSRTEALLSLTPTSNASFTLKLKEHKAIRAPTAWLRLAIYRAGLKINPFFLSAACVFSAVALTITVSSFLSAYLLPLFFFAGFALPISWVHARAAKRAAEFLADYPSALLATASSLKVGMTAYAALERSVKLLAADSLVRKEIENLIADLRRGLKKEEAVANFAASINLPDLDLFRSAFLLVLEQGGRFGPTLERLAGVAKDRTNLIDGARVSTTNMRMTANILIAIAPLLLLLLSTKTTDYWDKFLNHPVANTIASVGICIIAASYLTLRSMSNFKP